jgi:hypothetical protein
MNSMTQCYTAVEERLELTYSFKLLELTQLTILEKALIFMVTVMVTVTDCLWV